MKRAGRFSKRRVRDAFVSISTLGMLALAAFMASSENNDATAASIAWDPPFDIVSDADIDRSAGTILDAVNAINTMDMIDVMIGGDTISFRPVDFSALMPGSASQTAQGTFFTVGDPPNSGDTGNPELNLVLDSHAWSGQLWSFELTSLSPGEVYQIQLIAGADRRNCCLARTMQAGDGAGNFSGDYSRGGPGSVIGRFTADSDVQTIEIQGGAVPTDPSISAYLLSVVDEGSIPGDVNRDNVVDLFDYEIIRDNLFTGITRDLGDLNFSGLVDYADFRIWKEAFAAGGAGAAVPEPATWMLLLCGTLFWGLRGKRRIVR